MSASIVALLILLGFVAAAIVFTLVFVVVVDRSIASTRAENEEERDKEKRQGEGRAGEERP